MRLHPRDRPVARRERAAHATPRVTRDMQGSGLTVKRAPVIMMRERAVVTRRTGSQGAGRWAGGSASPHGSLVEHVMLHASAPLED